MWITSDYHSHFFRTLGFLLSDIFLWVYAACWFLIRYCRMNDMPVPYLNNWLTDLVYVPLICAVCHWIFLNVMNTPARIRSFPLVQILVLATFVAVVFEGVMPHYTDYNTADPIDVLCYYLGGLFYYFIHQKYVIAKYTAKINVNLKFQGF